jgi:hypothetical protein
MKSGNRKFLASMFFVGAALALSACGGGGDGGLFSPFPSEAKLVSIEVKADQSAVAAGKDATFSAIGHFSDGAVIDITSSSSSGSNRAMTSVKWAASPESVARFSYNNTLSTKAQGSVVVSATDFFSGVIGSTSFTVAAPTQAFLSLDGLADKQTISARANASLTARAYNSDGSPVTGSSIVWTTSNAAVATVDSNGLFQAHDGGPVTITASSGSLSKSLSLTVLAALKTPIFTFSCDPMHPTVINAQQWNNQYAIDSNNLTEWFVVDGASCQAYPVVELLVQRTTDTKKFQVVFSAERSAANAAIFKPAQTNFPLVAGEPVAVGSATDLAADVFTLLYNITAK